MVDVLFGQVAAHQRRQFRPDQDDCAFLVRKANCADQPRLPNAGSGGGGHDDPSVRQHAKAPQPWRHQLRAAQAHGRGHAVHEGTDVDAEAAHVIRG